MFLTTLGIPTHDGVTRFGNIKGVSDALKRIALALTRDRNKI
jgi:hypothetical protein